MRRFLWFALGLLLLGAGLAVALTTQVGSTDFGWYAYTPLEDPDWHMGWGDDALGQRWLIVSRWTFVGLGIATLGLAVLAGGIGYWLGRRRVRPADR